MIAFYPVFWFCSHDPTESDSSVKMHRSVFSSDVREYSTGVRVKDVQLEKEEDIEYRSGHLYYSSGSTTVKLVKPRKRFSGKHTILSLQAGPLNEEMISANGSYELDLLNCYSVPSTAKRGRRSEKKLMIKGSLKAVVNRGYFSLQQFLNCCFRAVGNKKNLSAKFP